MLVSYELCCILHLLLAGGGWWRRSRRWLPVVSLSVAGPSVLSTRGSQTTAAPDRRKIQIILSRHFGADVRTAHKQQKQQSDMHHDVNPSFGPSVFSLQQHHEIRFVHYPPPSALQQSSVRVLRPSSILSHQQHPIYAINLVFTHNDVRRRCRKLRRDSGRHPLHSRSSSTLRQGQG